MEMGVFVRNRKAMTLLRFSSFVLNVDRNVNLNWTR